ncbi:hypothetical protein [Pseudooceanicola sp. HF7]|uniref:hypothetical protein n=1 Tax=Pseudooceanicola sp. HF7 TaxID=2721560 RepID=UPI00142FC90F|nr:hypothetical protein [Pseudooceanicola sp. HF7]NIZ09707.1 hypothetical protein [Pseudooceanicola sp. HF7]
MATQNETNVFDTELFFMSYRNLFPEDVPTGRAVFEKLAEEHAAKPFPTLEYQARKVYIAELVLSGDWVDILFHLTDPEIRDRDYSNLDDGTLRTAERMDGEEPAFSSHVSICIATQFDTTRTYPCIIQETESLSRTLISISLNTYIKPLFYEENRARPDKGDTKTFRVTAKLQAPIDETLSGMIDNGGRIEAVKFVEQSLAQVVNGDETYPTQEQRSVLIKTDEKPTLDRAKDFITSFYSGFDRSGIKSLKVIVYDPENDTNKTIPVNLNDDNILQNAFIKKIKLTGFDTPLKDCDATIREDILTKMKGVRPNAAP